MIRLSVYWKGLFITISVIVLIIISLLVISTNYHTSIVDAGDMRNWVSLVIEVGIGLIITLIILFYNDSQQSRSDAQQQKITELISKVEKIQSEQHNRETRRKQYFGEDAVSYLEAIKSHHDILRIFLTGYQNKSTEEDKNNIILSAKKHGEIIEQFFVPHIIRYMKEIDGLLNDPKLATQIIAGSQSFATMFKDIQDESTWQNNLIPIKIQGIDETIKIISSYVERLKKETTKN